MTHVNRVHKIFMGTKIYFSGVKGTGPLAEGSEGRQSLPFFAPVSIPNRHINQLLSLIVLQ